MCDDHDSWVCVSCLVLLALSSRLFSLHLYLKIFPPAVTDIVFTMGCMAMCTACTYMQTDGRPKTYCNAFGQGASWCRAIKWTKLTHMLLAILSTVQNGTNMMDNHREKCCCHINPLHIKTLAHHLTFTYSQQKTDKQTKALGHPLYCRSHNPFVTDSCRCCIRDKQSLPADVLYADTLSGGNMAEKRGRMNSAIPLPEKENIERRVCLKEEADRKTAASDPEKGT